MNLNVAGERINCARSVQVKYYQAKQEYSPLHFYKVYSKSVWALNNWQQHIFPEIDEIKTVDLKKMQVVDSNQSLLLHNFKPDLYTVL